MYNEFWQALYPVFGRELTLEEMKDICDKKYEVINDPERGEVPVVYGLRIVVFPKYGRLTKKLLMEPVIVNGMVTREGGIVDLDLFFDGYVYPLCYIHREEAVEAIKSSSSYYTTDVYSSAQFGGEIITGWNITEDEYNQCVKREREMESIAEKAILDAMNGIFNPPEENE